MATLLQNKDNPEQFYAGIRGTKILWATYEDGLLFGPVVFITEEARENAQLELKSFGNFQPYQL